MTELSHYRLSRNLRAASFGLFLVLVGVFLAAYPLVEESRSFFRDLRPAPIFDQVYYPAPSSPHPSFYHILSNFSIIWGGWLGLLVIIQLVVKDRPRRVAHTLGDCVSWIGAWYFLDKLAAAALSFGSFLSVMIVVVGVSLIVRALTLAGLEGFRH